jgi:hypothetical protein
MNRVTLIASAALFGLGGLALGLSQGGQSAVQAPDAPVVVQGTGAANDPCADYVNQGVACEYLAFPEMELRAGTEELASVQAP